VVRINAAARENGLTYGQLIAGLKAAGNPIDRKTLADLAVTTPAAFAKLAQVAAEARPAQVKRVVTGDAKAARPKARAAAEATRA
jgi:large subunit ribosomal protein L20